MDRPQLDVLCAAAAGPIDLSTAANRLGLDAEIVEEIVDDSDAFLEVIEGRIALRAHLGYDAPSLRKLLSEDLEVVCVEEATSTNELAMTYLDEEHERVLVTAERQTAGRGRGERTWHSPPGGIWASVADGRQLSTETAWVDQFAMAVAVTEAMSALGVDVAIKWPNDVNDAEGRKLAGILVHSRTSGTTRTRTVCGVGLNANVENSALPAGATSLRQHCGPVERAVVLAHIVHAYEALREDPTLTRSRWSTRAETLGRHVEVQTPDGTRSGMARSIGEGGALVIETDGELVDIPLGKCERLRYAHSPV